MAIWAAIFGTIFSIGVGNIIILNIYNHIVIKLDMVHYFFNVLNNIVYVLYMNLKGDKPMANILHIDSDRTTYKIVDIAL